VAPSDCPFCRIAARHDKAHIVAETDECLAFLPLSPATRGHILVIPKVHVENVYDIGPDLAASVLREAVRLAGAVRSAFHPDGVNLITSTGQVATQTVPHFHFHVVPRWPHDGITLAWPEKQPWDDADLDKVASLIKQATH
jgi:histidine triad (HIT) family protein